MHMNDVASAACALVEVIDILRHDQNLARFRRLQSGQRIMRGIW